MGTNGFCSGVCFAKGIYFQDRKTFSLAIDFAWTLAYFYVSLFHSALLYKKGEIVAMLNETVRLDGVLAKRFKPFERQRKMKSDGVDFLLELFNPSNFVFPFATLGLVLTSPYDPRYLLHYLAYDVKGYLTVAAFAVVEYRIHCVVAATIQFHMLLLATYGRMSSYWVNFLR